MEPTDKDALNALFSLADSLETSGRQHRAKDEAYKRLRERLDLLARYEKQADNEGKIENDDHCGDEPHNNATQAPVTNGDDAD